LQDIITADHQSSRVAKSSHETFLCSKLAPRAACMLSG
jgi:hypothetical protein